VRGGGAGLARLVLLVAAGLTGLLAACASTGEPLFRPFARTGPYNELSGNAWEQVAEARIAWDSGDLRLARATLLRVAADFPRHIYVGVMIQELELELLGYKVALPDLGFYKSALIAEGVDRPAMLRRYYRDRADRAPSPENYVLAARLESDLPAARSLLMRALDLDPECAWAHYGAAHVAFQSGDYREARARLASQVELDPGLLPARRLRVRMLASSESGDVAIQALDRWLKDARKSLFVRPKELAEGEFDLVLLLADTDEYERVEELAAKLLEDGFVDSTSVYLVLAATRIADDHIVTALDAAKRASRSSPSSTLAHIQRALILENWKQEPVKAFDAWARALEAATGAYDEGLDPSDRPEPGTIRDAQLWLFARTRLARLKLAGVSGSTRAGPNER